MASRLTYFKILKRIHFYSSIVIFIFVLMYIVTGFIIAKHHWFPPGERTKASQTYAFNHIVDTTQFWQLGKDLKNEFNISGRQIGPRKTKKGHLIYRFLRPGIEYDAIIHPERDSITLIRAEQQTLYRVSSRLHLLRGFNGGYKYFIWAILYDISAIAFILYAITGILIWFRNRKVLKYGWYIIIPVLVLCVVFYVYLM